MFSVILGAYYDIGYSSWSHCSILLESPFNKLPKLNLQEKKLSPFKASY